MARGYGSSWIRCTGMPDQGTLVNCMGRLTRLLNPIRERFPWARVEVRELILETTAQGDSTPSVTPSRLRLLSDCSDWLIASMHGVPCPAELSLSGAKANAGWERRQMTIARFLTANITCGLVIVPSIVREGPVERFVIF